MSIQNLQGIVVFLVVLGMFELFPIQLSIVSWRCLHRKTVRDKVKIRPIPKRLWLWYHLPLSCVCLTYKNFFKKYGLTKITAIVAAMLMGIRILMFLPFMDSLAVSIGWMRILYALSVPAFLLGILIFHVLHVVVYFRVMRLFRFGTLHYILLFVAPYVVAALMKSSIPMQLFNDKEALSSRFDENYKLNTKRKVKKGGTTATTKRRPRRTE